MFGFGQASQLFKSCFIGLPQYLRFQLSVTVVVNLVFLGMRKFKACQGGIQTEAGAFQKFMAVANANDYMNSKVSPQIFACGPR